MNGVLRRYFEGQNITAKRITLTLLGLATFLIFLTFNGNFAYSQDEQLGSAPSGNETIPSSSNSSQAPSGFVTEGTINTLITVPNGKWLAAGNWSLILNNGNVTSFDTKMTWYNSSGTNAHTHELSNFRKVPSDVQASPVSASAKQIIIEGVTDVGSNGKVSWVEIPTTITINDRKIISIAIDDTKTNRHFGGQPLLGIVESFVPCSDLPGPNMEILPSCSVSTVGNEIFGQSNETLGLPTEGFLPFEGAPPAGEFPQEGFPEQGLPEQGFPGGEFPSEDDQSQGGEFPSEDDQSQGGEFPSEDDQS